LPLRVVRSSNVREGPGTSFKILFVLEAGAEVMGHAYEAQWVRISLADGRGGWIYSTLVESHSRERP
jgi:SH3-like domain-containing protein